MILPREVGARARKGKFHLRGLLWRMFLPVRPAVRGARHAAKLARFGGQVGRAGSTYGWGVTTGATCSTGSTSRIGSRRHSSMPAPSVEPRRCRVRDLTARHSGDQGHGGLPSGADLTVAADGVRSELRTRHSAHVGTWLTPGRNHYVRLGATKVFDAFTFAFTESRPSCTAGSTGRPGSRSRCAGSARRSRGPCTYGRRPPGNSPPSLG
jgi:hypothetical protein